MNEQVPERHDQQYIIPSEIVEMLTNIDVVLERIEAYLRGMTYFKNSEGVWETKKIGKMLLNEQGIQEIIQTMKKRLDAVLYSTTNIDLEFIKYEVWFFNLNLVELLAKKGKEWDLKKEYFQEMIDHLTSCYESILRKSLNAIYLQFISGSLAQKYANENEEKKKKKFFIF